MKTQVSFSEIYKSFDNSMRALHKLQVFIQDSLGSSEWRALEEYYHEAFSVFEGYDPVEIQTIMEGLIRIDVEDETLDIKKVWETVKVEPDDILRLENEREVFLKEIQEGLNVFAKQFPEQANKFFRAYLKSQRDGPQGSELSRHGLLLSATSQFEFLLLHLLRAYFVYCEGDLELTENYTIEELDQHISQRFRKRNIKQLSAFEKLEYLTSKFMLTEGFSRERLKEIFERRNVFVHRSGRADETYIQYNKRVKVGDRLRISQNYIKATLDYLHLWGLVLSARVWEKSNLPDAQLEMAKTVSNAIMQLIREDRCNFGEVLCERLHANVQFPSQNSRDILMINYAICLDRLGKEKEKVRVLSGIRQSPREFVPKMRDLSVSEPFFYAIPMAVNALLGKNQYALDWLDRAADTQQITFLDLDYWVIFDYLRDEPRFQLIREKLESKVKVA